MPLRALMLAALAAGAIMASGAAPSFTPDETARIEASSPAWPAGSALAQRHPPSPRTQCHKLNQLKDCGDENV